MKELGSTGMASFTQAWLTVKWKLEVESRLYDPLSVASSTKDAKQYLEFEESSCVFYI